MQAKAPVVAPLSGAARAFLDFCRVEKGLAANSISSYRTDLKRLTLALPVREADATAEHLSGYVQSLYNAGMSARSVARHIATLRGFYAFLAREGAITTDPAEFLTAPRQWTTLPKYLNREEVERLIAIPGSAKPTGLRDRAMLELLYATGLRVSELCGLELAGVERELGVLRVVGKGNKHRMVPFGESAGAALDTYLREGRGVLLAGRASPLRFRDGARGRDNAPGLLAAAAELRAQGWNHGPADAARGAAQFRHSPGGGGRGSAECSGDAGACRHFHDSGLYARSPAAASRSRRSASSACLRLASGGNR